MPSRRCCCTDCVCPTCAGGAGPCCITIVIGETTYEVTWESSCTWVDDLAGITLTIVGTTLTITIGSETYEETIAEGTDCKALVSLEIPNTDGVSASAYITADGDVCYTCACNCAECADVAEGRNAACCWLVEIAGEWIPLTRGGGENDGYDGSCVWTGVACDGTTEVPVTLSILANSITFTIGESSWTETYEEKPGCCDQIAIGGYTLYSSDTNDCLQHVYCIDAAISGVTADPCDCPSCGNLNNTFRLASIEPFLGWQGTVQQILEWPVCTYGIIKVWYDARIGKVYATLTSCVNDSEICQAIVRWEGSYPTGSTIEDLDGLVLSFVSQTWSTCVAPAYDLWGEWKDCNFSGSTITISLVDLPCGCQSGPPCTFPDIPATCACASGLVPTYVELDIPTITGSGGGNCGSGGCMQNISNQTLVVVRNETYYNSWGGFHGELRPTYTGICDCYQVDVDICGGSIRITLYYLSYGGGSNTHYFELEIPTNCELWIENTWNCFHEGDVPWSYTPNVPVYCPWSFGPIAIRCY